MSSPHTLLISLSQKLNYLNAAQLTLVSLFAFLLFFYAYELFSSIIGMLSKIQESISLMPQAGVHIWGHGCRGGCLAVKQFHPDILDPNFNILILRPSHSQLKEKKWCKFITSYSDIISINTYYESTCMSFTIHLKWIDRIMHLFVTKNKNKVH